MADTTPLTPVRRVNMKTSILSTVVAIAVGFAFVAPASAATVSVDNPSFEDPVLAENGFAAAPGWSGSYVAFNPSAGLTPPGGIPDGNNVLAMNFNSFAWQFIEDAGDSAIGVSVGQTVVINFEAYAREAVSRDLRVWLFNGDAFNPVTDILAPIQTITPPADDFAEFSLAFVVQTADATPAFLFQHADTGTPISQLWVDNVSVSIIPTPAALPAGLALLGLAATRRRRRN